MPAACCAKPNKLSQQAVRKAFKQTNKQSPESAPKLCCLLHLAALNPLKTLRMFTSSDVAKSSPPCHVPNPSQAPMPQILLYLLMIAAGTFLLSLEMQMLPTPSPTPSRPWLTLGLHSSDGLVRRRFQSTSARLRTSLSSLQARLRQPSGADLSQMIRQHDGLKILSLRRP